MPVRYDGHHCYHALFNQTPVNSPENSVKWCKETIPTVEEIECHVSLFNCKLYGHIRELVKDYPNVKKVTFIKDTEYPIDFLNARDLNQARRHIREIIRDFRDILELEIDPAILESRTRQMEYSDFIKVISKTASLAWVKHRLIDEVLDPDDELNRYDIHYTLLPWIFGALNKYDERFTEEMYVNLLHENMKYFKEDFEP